MRVPAAIRGIAASFDGCDGLADFERAMHTGARSGAPLPAGESIDALAARLVQAALVDAGIGATSGGRIALLVLGDDGATAARLASSAAAPPASVGETHASPGETRASAGETRAGTGESRGFGPGAFVEALRRVDDLLARAPLLARDARDAADRVGVEGVDAVVLAGVSEAPRRGGAAVVFTRSDMDLAPHDLTPGTVNLAPHGPTPGIGVYGTLAGAAWATAVERAGDLALAQAQAAPEDVGYLEAWAAADGASDGREARGIATSDDREARGLATLYRRSPSGGEPTTAVGGLRSVVGEVGAAAHAVAVLVRMALAARDRFLPGNPAWKGPRDAATWRASGLYVPDAARAWFVPSAQARLAAGQVLDVGPDGATWIHLVLRDATRATGATHASHATRATPRYRAVAPLHLVPLVGRDPPALLDALAACEAALAGGADPAQVAANAYASARASIGAPPGEPLAMALLGRDRAELAQEIASARRSFARALETGADWQTPRGSCFAPRPLGARGTVAFLYPGAFTAYPGVLRDTFQVFPSLHEPRGAWPSDVGRVLAQHLLYPRSVDALDADAKAAFEARLYASPAEMITATTLCGVATTRIMRETFGLQPGAAFGYSLGETTVCWALGVWTDGDALQEMHALDLFRTRLGGPREALREFWLRRGRPDRAEAGAWTSHVLVTSASNVAAALTKEAPGEVFLLAIHSPTEVVIGGAPEACARLIARLRCDQVPMPFPLMLHSEVLATEFDRFVAASLRPTSKPGDIALYSATEPHGAFIPETEDLARRIARMVTQPFDFSALIQRVYAGGARIFLELGPGATCTRLVTANLLGRDHVAIALDRRGVDSQTGVLRALARLFAHRAAVDLTPLYAR